MRVNKTKKIKSPLFCIYILKITNGIIDRSNRSNKINVSIFNPLIIEYISHIIHINKGIYR